MRLLLTTYQKSGTHQIMPVFTPIEQLVDRSYQQMNAVNDFYDIPINTEEINIQETIDALKSFKNKAFGHITFRNEYAYELLRDRVLFNIRDPRDIIAAEIHNADRKYLEGEKTHTWLNLRIENEYLFDLPDRIEHLIKIAKIRWTCWLGWLDFPNISIIRYEDLRLKPEKAYEENETLFLENGVSFEHLIKSLQPKKKNPTFITGRVGDWKWMFSSREKKLAEKFLGGIINALGYDV